MSQSRPKVLAILPSTIASCIILVVKPLTALANKGLINLNIVLENNASVKEIDWADVVVFCRNTEPAYSDFLDAALAYGKPVIFDLDDNFFEIPFDHDPELAAYHRAPFRLQQLQQYLVHADLVRVYSPAMQNLIGKFNRNIKLVKAGVDFELLSKTDMPKRKDGIVHIVYATSRIVDAQYKLFLSAINEILERFPNAVDLSVWGCQPQELLGHSAVNVFPLVSDYQIFLQKFERAGFDIGLAPLENTFFNQCKGNTKYRDYGACKIAGIYSNVDVYSRSVIHETTGILVDDDHNSWRDALIKLIFQHKLREDIQNAAYKDVCDNYRLELIEQEFFDQINNLLGRYKRVRQANNVITQIGIKTTQNNWTGVTFPLASSITDLGEIKLHLEIFASNGNRLRGASATSFQFAEPNCVSFEFATIINAAQREFMLKIIDAGKIKSIDDYSQPQFAFANV